MSLKLDGIVRDRVVSRITIDEIDFLMNHDHQLAAQSTPTIIRRHEGDTHGER